MQRASRAAFAWVVIEAHDAEVFSVDTQAVDAYWRPGAAFGASYALEKALLVGEPRGRRIVVVSVQGTVVDTNQMAVAFAAYQAACLALAIVPDERVRLREDWTYEFPA